MEVSLPIRVHHSDLLEIIKLRPDFDRVSYRIDARLGLDSPFGKLFIPVNKDDVVFVPEEYRSGTLIKRLLQPFKDML